MMMMRADVCRYVCSIVWTGGTGPSLHTDLASGYVGPMHAEGCVCLLEKFGDRPIIVRTNSTQLRKKATCRKTRKGKKGREKS